MLRRWPNIVTGLALVGAAAFLINLAIDNPYSHRIVASIINDKVTELTTVNLSFQAIEVRAFPPGFDLFGLKITPRAHPEMVLLEAAQLNVRVAIASLALGRPKLSLVEINELRTAFPLPKGIEPIMQASDIARDETLYWPPSGAIAVKRLRIMNSSIRVASAVEIPKRFRAFDTRWGGVNVDIRLGSWEDIDIDFETKALSIVTAGAELLSEAKVTFSAELKQQQITTSDLDISSEWLKAKGEVTLDLLTEAPEEPYLILKAPPRPHLAGIKATTKLLSTADFKILGAFLGIGDTDGTATGNVEMLLESKLTEPQSTTFKLSGQAKAANARIDGFKILDSGADFSIDTQGINFQRIMIAKGEEFFGYGSGSISFNDALDFEFRAQPKKLPLVTLLDALLVPEFDIIDAMISSDDLVLTGRGFPFGLEIKANADFDSLQSPFLRVSKPTYTLFPSCKFVVNLKVTSQSLLFDGSSGTCNESKASGPSLTGSQLVLSGHTAFTNASGMDLKIAAPQLDLNLGQAFAQIALSGHGHGEARIHGSYDQLLIDGALDVQDASAQGLHLGHLSGQYSIDAKVPHARFRNIEARTEGGMHLSIAKLGLELNDRYAMTMTATAENIPQDLIATAVALADPGLKFGFSIKALTADLTGPLLMPLAWQGTAKVALIEGLLDADLLFSEIDATLTAGSSGISTQDLNFYHGSYRGLVTASHHRETPFSWEKAHGASQIFERLGWNDSDRFTLSLKTPPRAGGPEEGSDHLAQLPFIGPYLARSGVAGTIDGEFSLDGTLQKLEGQFSGAINDLKVLDSAVAPLEFKGFINGKKIEVPIISHSGRALRGRFMLDFGPKDLPYSWFFALDNLDLRNIFGPIFYNDPRNFFYVKGDWAMKGTLKEWWSSTGNLGIHQVRAQFTRDVNGKPQSLALQQAEPVRMTISPKAWEFERGQLLVLNGPDLELKLGTAANRPPDALGLNLTGTANMAILRNLITQIESARGRLALSGGITGSVADPEVAVTVKDRKMDASNAAKWEPISIGIGDIPPAFTNIKTELTYHNGRLDITSFTADKGKEGRLNLSGGYTFASTDDDENQVVATFDRLELFHLPIPVFDTLDATLSGNLSLQGTELPLKLSGSVNVDSAKSITNFDIRNRILQAIGDQSIGKNRAPTDPMLDLNIHLLADDSIYIKNRNMAATLGTNLVVTGTEAAPTALGVVSIPRGKFSYKRDFEIRRGLLLFDEPVSPPDPKIDIIGESSVGGYRVNVTVNGYASDPKVSLTADPSVRPDGTAISKFDILVLLSSGEFPQGEHTTAGSAAAQSEALSIVAGQFEEPIEKLFELSGQNFIGDVYLDSYTQSVDSSKGTRGTRPVARLNLPVKLTDDFGMKLQVDDDSNMKVSSDYAIHENITASVVVDKKNEADAVDSQGLPDTGVDLRFRFTFP